MSMWGNKNQANNAPEYKIEATANANGSAMFANTLVGAFVKDEATGVYGVPGANGSTDMASAGWIEEKMFTGPVKSFVVSTAGAGYTNTDTVTASANGAVNATGVLTVNATGAIQSVTTTNTGSGFFDAANTTFTITSANANAAGGVITATFGGRAGRRQYETLVAMSSITNNAGPTPA